MPSPNPSDQKLKNLAHRQKLAGDVVEKFYARFDKYQHSLLADVQHRAALRALVEQACRDHAVYVHQADAEQQRGEA